MKQMDTTAAQKAAKRPARQRAKDRSTSFEGKTFEDLNGPEKDVLLKHIAVKLGLIQDSD